VTTSEKITPTRVMETVKKLRLALGDTQQQFATRLGIAISTAVRYELSRAPKGKALEMFEKVARAHGRHDEAHVFKSALLIEQLAGTPLTIEESYWVHSALYLMRNRQFPGIDLQCDKILGALSGGLHELAEESDDGKRIFGAKPGEVRHVADALKSFLNKKG
jgi:transcriptional regulator with XRE-family HTH domain